MQLRSENAASPTTSMAALRHSHRRHFRQKIHNLAYINLDYSNGGIIRNVSESGIAIQVVTPVEENQEVQVRFDLLNPRTRVEARGRVAWTDSSGQAGLEFLAITPRSRRQLKEWLFTQLLGAASQAAASASILLAPHSDKLPAELTLSSATIPVIQIAKKTPLLEQPATAEAVSPWYPIPESPRTLGRMIDVLIVATAVLLFGVIALAMTNIFPAWPVGLALIAAATMVFTAVYWLLFVTWIGLTPGSLLAGLASGVLSQNGEPETEDIPRFR
jgi:hypothetical protein